MRAEDDEHVQDRATASTPDGDPVTTMVPVDDRTSPETREIINFLTTTGSADVPGDVLHESKRCLLDFLGLAVAAAAEPAVAIPRQQFEILGGHPQAHALGTAIRLRVTDAAMVNGVAGHAFDFDDTHLPTILHGTTPVYAAGLALGEWCSASGLDLLAAHAIGFEIGARVSLALYPEHYDVGWHMTGTTGSLAAAAAGIRILELESAAATHGLSIAATLAGGHREQFGTMTKPLHAGRAAADGVLAALLAQAGFSGAPDPLQGKRGMFALMSSRSTPGDLVDGLGRQWEIFNNGFKPYACGVVTHPAIDAVRRLRDDKAWFASDVDRIELRVHPLVPELTGKTEPRTGLEGKFSVVFACAIALIEGSASERQFTDINVTRDDVRDLMRRITLIPSDDLDHTQAEAVVWRRDGQTTTIRVEHASGTPENRLSDADLAEKFHSLADPALGAAQAAILERMVWDLDSAASLDDLLLATVPKNGP